MPSMRPFHCDITAIASVGETVFIERRDSMVFDGDPLTVHITGVYEVDDNRTIAVWRDYFDQREARAQRGPVAES